jgi:hypothetical protein
VRKLSYPSNPPGVEYSFDLIALCADPDAVGWFESIRGRASSSLVIFVFSPFIAAPVLMLPYFHAHEHSLYYFDFEQRTC